MMRKTVLFLLVLALCTAAVMPVFAQNDFLVDDADLLSVTEERQLQEQIAALNAEFDADIVIVTVETTGNYDPEEYIEYFYDGNDYGVGNSRDGVMLLVAMEEREFKILSNGYCGDAISYSEIDFIVEAMQEDMSDGEYADAFDTFLGECRYYLDGYLNGFPFELGGSLIISLVIGLVVALIATGVMRGKLKSVRKQESANQYTKSGSMQITNATELYLYRNVTRVRKAQNSSGSSRSGGGSRSIGGGRF